MTPQEYFKQHGISEESIKEFGITYSETKIIIPIRDSNGNHLYNKYRHLTTHPNRESSKFTFDFGSRNAIFNISVLKDARTVFVVEGEPDCIRLHQEGLAVVTNTTGAGSIKEEWAELFRDKEVYVCFDNDAAGKSGAGKVANILVKTASSVGIVNLPSESKDICEYFLDHNIEQFNELINHATVVINEQDFNSQVRKDLFNFISWKEFKAQEFEEPKWIIKNILPEKGLLAVSGPPEACKSYFSIFLAILVATGSSLFDTYTTIKTPVLLVDQENLSPWIQKRISQFTTEEDVPLYIFQKQDAQLSIKDEDHFGRIVEFVEDNNIGLVIIDTLRLIHDEEENSSTAMKPVFDLLKKLTTKTAVLFIHHHRKGDRLGRGRMSGEDMMGSIFIRGSVDYQLTLTKVLSQEGVTRVRISQTKSRYTLPIKPFEVTLEGTDSKLAFTFQGEVQEEKIKKDEVKGMMLALLETQNLTKKNFIEEIVDEGVCSVRTLETAFKELEVEKKIVHTTSKPYVYSLSNQLKDISQLATTNSDYDIAS